MKKKLWKFDVSWVATWVAVLLLSLSLCGGFATPTSASTSEQWEWGRKRLEELELRLKKVGAVEMKSNLLDKFWTNKKNNVLRYNDLCIRMEVEESWFGVEFSGKIVKENLDHKCDFERKRKIETKTIILEEVVLPERTLIIGNP
ncbi:MAG: hypothetical protein F6K23_02650 [Okeania sp. SIO2C9]|uniref:hypothetical protein n=1 Tax=Okeania sp. SIO2C9 TaxID=2607791 RepID=UPI0013C0E543|nr:hypothetical protein [Okeania sp. SIO2C9]NEQ72072.1 hypothetical protein [Okeania sp. SIO2C9]